MVSPLKFGKINILSVLMIQKFLLYPDSESIQMFNKYSKTVSKKSKSCVSFKTLFPLLHTRAASSSNK